MKLHKTTDSEIQLTLSTRTIVRALALIIAAVMLVVVVRLSLDTLVLIGTSVFLALALNSPVRWLAAHLPGKMRNNRNMATTISIIAIVGALVGFVWAIAPPVIRQTASFIKNVPQLIDEVQNQDSAVGEFIRDYNLGTQINKYADQLTNSVGDIGGSAMNAVTTVGSSVFAVLTVLVLTVMMLLEGPRWVALGYEIIPSRKRAHAKKLAERMLRVIQGYVNGQVTLAFIAAVLLMPVFLIMDVNYPIALMFIVFVCGLIPMVGHTVGAVICTLIALFTSLPAALVVLGYYILYQQIENYAVQPRVQANSTNMTPLLVFVAVLLGANFGGLLGALVAIPIMGCIRILLIDYLERRDILTPAEVMATINGVDNSEAPTKKRKN